MSGALALLLTLGLAAGEGELKIANPHATYGYLGATRPRQGILAGDVAYFTFDVKNLKLDKHGQASYSLLVEVFDAKGRKAFRIGPRNATAVNCLGGHSLPCSAQMVIPLGTEPGIYTMRVKIHDRLADRGVVFETKGKVLPPDFGLVRVGTFADRAGQVPIAPVGVPGQAVYVNFSAVGFGRDKDSKLPDIKVALRVLDEKGASTGAVPLTGRAHEGIAEAAPLVGMQLGLTLNRVGRFTLELSATDQIDGKTARVTFPLRVVAP
jgi:hypothetical protein